MQLRNGKQLVVLGTKINPEPEPEPESVVPLFIDTVRKMLDKCNNIVVFVDKINNVFDVFVSINHQSTKTLVDFSVSGEYLFISTIYTPFYISNADFYINLFL
jgi:hypothetical protein